MIILIILFTDIPCSVEILGKKYIILPEWYPAGYIIIICDIYAKLQPGKVLLNIHRINEPRKRLCNKQLLS